jgi:hypothetical protein
MAEKTVTTEKVTTEKVEDKKADIKTKKVRILRFHPLIAHEKGEVAEMEEKFADILIEKEFAEAAK